MPLEVMPLSFRLMSCKFAKVLEARALRPASLILLLASSIVRTLARESHDAMILQPMGPILLWSGLD